MSPPGIGSKETLPVYKPVTNVPIFSSLNADLMTAISFFFGEIAKTAGNPNPRLSYLSRSN